MILLVSFVLIIILSVLYQDEIVGIIIGVVGFVISLPASILSFLVTYSLPKDYKTYSQCRNFLYRTEIIRQIIKDINKGCRTIKIAGTPNSGVSELLIRLAELKNNKKLFSRYIKDKRGRKIF